jgi:quercetin dioxygenase-like cupin family protein
MVLRTALHRWELKPGDVVAYAGDQAHTYSNPGHEPAVAITVVRLAE